MPFDGRERSLDVRSKPIDLVEEVGVVAVPQDHSPPGRMPIRSGRPSELRREVRLAPSLRDLRDVPSARIRRVPEERAQGGLHSVQQGPEHRAVRGVRSGQRPSSDQPPSLAPALADDMELAELSDREPPPEAERPPLPPRVLPEARRVRRDRSNSSARVPLFFLKAASTRSLSSRSHSSENRRSARHRVMREGASSRPICRRRSEATQRFPSACR